MAPIPLVLGPGLMCDEALFVEQVSHLADRREVRVADFTRQVSIEEMASDLLRDVPGQFCYAGLSMGGIVGFELCRQAPERIAALVLMNTTAEPDTPAKRASRLRQIERARAGELETIVLEELKPNYLAEQSRKDEATMREITAMAGRLGPVVFEQQSRALMSRADSRSTLGSITCPVALVAGDQDVLCPPEQHAQMQRRIERSELHVLLECGHLSTLEQPKRVNRILDGMLVQGDRMMEKQ